MMNLDTSFLSHKNSDAVDMCIGTCDIELDLHLTVNQSDDVKGKFNPLCVFKDRSDGSNLLSSYDALFNDLVRSDLLESVECSTPKVGAEIDMSLFEIPSSVEYCSVSDENKALDNVSRIWNSSIIDSKTLLSLPECKDNFNWECLYNSNKENDDLVHLLASHIGHTENDIDTNEFSNSCREVERTESDLLNDSCGRNFFISSKHQDGNSKEITIASDLNFKENLFTNLEAGTYDGQKNDSFPVSICEKESVLKTPVSRTVNYEQENESVLFPSNFERKALNTALNFTNVDDNQVLLISNCDQNNVWESGVIKKNINYRKKSVISHPVGFNLDSAISNVSNVGDHISSGIILTPNNEAVNEKYVPECAAEQTQTNLLTSSESGNNIGNEGSLQNQNCEIVITKSNSNLKPKLKSVSCKLPTELTVNDIELQVRDEAVGTPGSNGIQEVSSNPSSLLQSSVKNDIEVVSSNEGTKQNVNGKSDNIKRNPESIAFVSISTNKASNTTEIIINTSSGKKILKGKTTDLMRATSKLQKIERVKSMNDSLDPNRSNKKTPNLLRKKRSDGVVTIGSLTKITNNALKPVEEGTEKDNCSQNDKLEAEEKPVSDALTELGINTDSLVCITSRNSQKSWVCPVDTCSKLYTKLSILRIHILSHYGVRPYKCNAPDCQWSFYTYFKLKRHKETHLKRKDFVCSWEGCGKRFTTIYNLNTHNKLHERPAESVCPVSSCGEKFQTNRKLEVHMKVHDNHEGQFVCSHCGRHYFSASSLNAHRRCHQHKEEELTCDWEGCGRTFDKPCRLKGHKRLHTGDKPYVCNFEGCGSAFSTASKLKRHEKKHSNDRKFSCAVEGCGKSFMRPEHLREHSQLHVGSKTFQCPIEKCRIKFSAKSTLYVHMKKHFNGQISKKGKLKFDCPLDNCNQRFICKEGLQEHVMKDHASTQASEYVFALYAEDDGVLVQDELPAFAAEVVQTIPAIPEDSASTSLLPNTSFMDSMGLSSNGIGEYDFLSNGCALSAVNHQPVVQDSDYETGHTLPEVPTDKPSSKKSISGSARTSYTYSDIVRVKKHGNGLPSNSSQLLSSNSDSIVSAGLLENEVEAGSYSIQDVLQSSSHGFNRYHGPAGLGEFQILLLDSDNSRHAEFPESTINLRDLE